MQRATVDEDMPELSDRRKDANEISTQTAGSSSLSETVLVSAELERNRANIDAIMIKLEQIERILLTSEVIPSNIERPQ